MGRPTATAPRSEPLQEHGAWLEVGRVVRPHGLTGALLVALYGDDPTNLVRSPRVRLEGGPGTVELGVERAEPGGFTSGGGARVRLVLGGLAGRGPAAAWAGARVSIPESVLAPLPPGEFYWRDLIGLECRTLDGTRVGTIEEIWPTGASDLLVVRRASGTVLVPAASPILSRIDAEEGTVWIDPPEGLLEEGA